MHEYYKKCGAFSEGKRKWKRPEVCLGQWASERAQLLSYSAWWERVIWSFRRKLEAHGHDHAHGSERCLRGEHAHCVFPRGSAQLGPESHLLPPSACPVCLRLESQLCKHDSQSGLHCSLLTRLCWGEFVFSKQALERDWIYGLISFYLNLF